MDLLANNAIFGQNLHTNDPRDPLVGGVKNRKLLKRVGRVPIWSIKLVNSDLTPIKTLIPVNIYENVVFPYEVYCFL